MRPYVVNPDGTVTFDPTPEDYLVLQEEERDLQSDEM